MNQQQRLERAVQEINRVLPSVSQRCPRGMTPRQADAVVYNITQARIYLRGALEQYAATR
jgi:hypothetical protein